MRSCHTSRNVFVDLGVNWCTTLPLYTRVAPGRRQQPWLVIGWEAAPLIVPFAERCMHHLQKGLPGLPLGEAFLPTGSTSELYWYIARTPELAHCASADHDAMKDCVFSHPDVRRNLSSVAADPRLSGNMTLLAHRLAIAHAWCVKPTRQLFLLPTQS